MKKHSARYHWLVDAGLFVGFILAFMMDLTGLALHQWLGVLVGILAGYHLVIHWAWVKAVAARFFKSLSRQPRQYFFLDAMLAISFVLMLSTGLVLSTWLKLTLVAYEAWRVTHVLSSLISLGLLAVKLALHWRWIITMAPWHRRTQPAASAPVVDFSRREFLGTLGLIGGAVTLAMVSGGKALSLGKGDALAQGIAPSAPLPTATPGTSRATGSSPAPTPAPTATPGTSPSAAATPTPTITPTPVSTPTPETQALTCAYLCPKRCSYPGRCRRYTDANGNGRCDWGECWTLSQQKQAP